MAGKYVGSLKCILKIHQFMNQFVEENDPINKRIVAVALFDYLAHDGFPLMVDHGPFMEVVRENFFSFHNEQAPEVFQLLKDEIKSFVSSGIVC